ncbi:hypothetical protein IE993_10405 [Klebsiella pneumoniae]|nr:hypothetical protein [Klebsiella pneumoniae]
MLAGFTGNANRMGRRRNHHHARQRHKNAFFIIYSIQKIKIKEVPKKPENSTAHPSGINDRRNEFSQECNQLRIFTASSVARTTNSLFNASNIHVYYD